MAIEKSLYTLPQGVSGEGMGAEIEIEIGLPAEPEITILEDGGVEITLEPSEDDELEAAPFEANLAEYMDDGDMSTLAKELS